MNHNKHNFKVGDVVIRDKGTASENKVLIISLTINGMFAEVMHWADYHAKPYSTMTNRLSPIK